MKDTRFEFLNHSKNLLPVSMELQSILNQCLVSLVGLCLRVKLNSRGHKKTNVLIYTETECRTGWCLKCENSKSNFRLYSAFMFLLKKKHYKTKTREVKHQQPGKRHIQIYSFLFKFIY